MLNRGHYQIHDGTGKILHEIRCFKAANPGFAKSVHVNWRQARYNPRAVFRDVWIMDPDPGTISWTGVNTGRQERLLTVSPGDVTSFLQLMLNNAELFDAVENEPGPMRLLAKYHQKRAETKA
jgi:hypothetical protein